MRTPDETPRERSGAYRADPKAASWGTRIVCARDIESTIMPVPSCNTLIARPSGGKVKPSRLEAFLPSTISAAHVSPTDCRTMMAVSAWDTSRTVLAMSSSASSSSAPSSMVVVSD